MLPKIQRRATKLIPSLGNLRHEERIQTLRDVQIDDVQIAVYSLVLMVDRSQIMYRQLVHNVLYMSSLRVVTPIV